MLRNGAVALVRPGKHRTHPRPPRRPSCACRWPVGNRSGPNLTAGSRTTRVWLMGPPARVLRFDGPGLSRPYCAKFGDLELNAGFSRQLPSPLLGERLRPLPTRVSFAPSDCYHGVSSYDYGAECVRAPVALSAVTRSLPVKWVPRSQQTSGVCHCIAASLGHRLPGVSRRPSPLPLL